MNNEKRFDQGSTLVTVAMTLLVLVIFLALAVDVASAYAERRKMQNAADAAALAGAEVLIGGGSDADVYNAISEYTLTQGSADSFESFYIPSGQAVGSGFVPSDATGVRIIARETVPTFFAGVMGINSMPAVGEAGGGFSPVDIVLVMDRSGSMDDDSCAGDISSCSYTYMNKHICEDTCGGVWTSPRQPITDAKEAAKLFVDLNNPTFAHLALASYAYDYKIDQSLTDNFGVVKTAIDNLSAAGCTNAAGGLYKGREELNGPNARSDAMHFIIFLTDGLPNKGLTTAQSCSSCPDYCPQAKEAAREQAVEAVDEHIVIHTIAMGSKADQALMQEVADITGGTFHYAPTSGDLDAVYEDIFNQIRLRLIQ